MDISTAITSLLDQQDLSETDMRGIMQAIMTGKTTDAQIAGFLIALRAKGESVGEIAAAAKVMRDLATKVEIKADNLVDMVGTGGDSTGTFNISTAASFVIAAAGGTVAKHGNRSVSSKSGSADLLETAGVKLDLSPEQVTKCVAEVGLGFMFAPMHHSAMKYAIGPRKEMAVRTIFNLLGPLTNPAGVKRQLTGVFAKKWLEPMARVLQKLGSKQVMIVHGEDGMDEISISAPTFITELKDGKISNNSISPEQFGFARADIKSIQVADSDESLALIQSVFADKPSPAHDIVCLNAGAAIYVAGIAESIDTGIVTAKQVISNGKALSKLEQLVKVSNSF